MLKPDCAKLLRGCFSITNGLETEGNVTGPNRVIQMYPPVEHYLLISPLYVDRQVTMVTGICSAGRKGLHGDSCQIYLQQISFWTELEAQLRFYTHFPHILELVRVGTSHG